MKILRPLFALCALFISLTSLLLAAKENRSTVIPFDVSDAIIAQADSLTLADIKDSLPIGGQGLSADEHGWEPIYEDSTADKTLLLSPKAGTFVSLCHDVQCTYDDEKTGFQGIKLLGGYGLLAPLKLADDRPNLTIVHEYNGEWVHVNPPLETDATMSCVRVGKQGYHEQDPDTATDSICVVKGANEDTIKMLEAIETWLLERNTALENS